MNLVQLKYAVEIADTGSINKAAENLYIGQPNLSRAIKELESSLNITIFHRSAKGMELTPDGENFIRYARTILKQVEDVENLFCGNKQPQKTFSVSVPRASYIGTAFARFSEQLSYEEGFEVLYKETNSSRTIKNVLEEGYHLGVIRYAEEYDPFYKQLFGEKKLVGEVIAAFKFVLVMNKDNPMAKLNEITYSDLENYIEIAHADPNIPSVPLTTVKKEELPGNPKRRIFVYERASQFEILSENIDAFMWVSPIPQETLERYNLVQRECADNNKTYKDVMIYKSEYTLSALDNRFITELTKSKRETVK